MASSRRAVAGLVMAGGLAGGLTVALPAATGVTPIAGAAAPAGAGWVPTGASALREVPGHLSVRSRAGLGSAGPGSAGLGSAGLGSAGLAGTSAAVDGAVTVVDNVTNLAGAYGFTLYQGGRAVTGALVLGQASYSSPQILPAGTYQVQVTVAATTAVIAGGTLTVTPRVDSSLVLYETGSVKAPSPALSEYADPVTSVPAGQAVVSFRPGGAYAGPLDAYLDGAKVASHAAEGSSVQLTVPPGAHRVTLLRAGTTTPPVYDRLLELGADSFDPLYTVDLPSGAGLAVGLTPSALGYQFTAADGGMFTFGGLPFLGSTGSVALNKPVVAGAESALGRDPGEAGYYLAASDGGVFDFGPAAPFEGSTGSVHLNAPIVGLAATANADGSPGYVMVASDGGVFTFNAPFYGSLGGQHLLAPAVGIAADPSTGGYVIALANGSFATFGPGGASKLTAPFALNAPIVGVAETPDGGGAWLVAGDGGVFNLGDAGYYGSTGGVHLNQPVVGIVSTYDGLGYALVARDGGVFTFGNTPFYGSTGGIHLNAPIVGGVG